MTIDNADAIDDVDTFDIVAGTTCIGGCDSIKVARMAAAWFSLA